MNDNEKWTAVNLGPRQAKAFNEAVSKFNWDAKTHKEITDYGEHLVTPMFTGNLNPASGPLMKAIREKYSGIVSGDNVRALIADIQAATAKLAETREVKRTTPEERAERARIIAENEEEHRAEAARIAAMQTHMYSLAETSAAIKRVLGVLFPRTKFSVRSDSYSMGCSIDVCWTDGPRGDEVKAVLDIFECCGFDGMQDLKTYNATPEWNGHRFDFHGDYVSGNRSVSASLLRAAAERFSRETGLPAPRVIEDGRHSYCEQGGASCGWNFYTHQADEYPDGWLSRDDSRYNDAASVVDQIAHHMSMEHSAIPFVTTWPDDSPEPVDSVRSVVFRILLGEVSKPKPELHAIEGNAALTENDEKDVYEIRFPSKPEPSVLDRLKSNGWRWTRFGACWYHKRTPSALQLAQELTGSSRA